MTDPLDLDELERLAYLRPVPPHQVLALIVEFRALRAVELEARNLDECMFLGSEPWFIARDLLRGALTAPHAICLAALKAVGVQVD